MVALIYLDQLDPPRKRFRNQIFAKFDWRCSYCGVPPSDLNPLTLDHVVAKHKGGETVTSNLAAACRRCNQDKGSKELETWWKAKAHYSSDRHQLLIERLRSLSSNN